MTTNGKYDWYPPMIITPKSELLRMIEDYCRIEGISEKEFCEKVVDIKYQDYADRKGRGDRYKQFNLESYLKITKFFGIGTSYEMPRIGHLALGSKIIMYQKPELVDVEFPPGQSPSPQDQFIEVPDNSCAPYVRKNSRIVIGMRKKKPERFSDHPYYVETQDGEFYIMIISKGTEADRYNLTHPVTAETMPNIAIECCAEIRFIIPNYAS